MDPTFLAKRPVLQRLSHTGMLQITALPEAEEAAHKRSKIQEKSYTESPLTVLRGSQAGSGGSYHTAKHRAGCAKWLE